MITSEDRGLSKSFDSRKFLEQWKQQKEKEEWLFAVAVVAAGLEHEGNLDDAAQREIALTLNELDISAEELHEYLQKNRSKLHEFLDSRPE